MKRGPVWVVLALVLFALCLAAAEPREFIVLHGGRTGQVAFPHLRHHEALDKDCNACHALFPQEAGAIDRLKRAGKLKKRQVMTNCTGCHKSRIKEKQPAGPISCKKCHVKKEGK